MVLRSLQLGDFVREVPQQSVLILFKQVDPSSAYLVQADFSSLQLDVSPIDTDQELEVGNYGRYRFQAMYPLLTLEKKPEYGIRSSFSFAVGRVLDAVWPVKNPLPSWQSSRDLQRLFLSSEISSLPLSWREKWHWWVLVHDARTQVNIHKTLTTLPMPPGMKSLSTTFSCSLALVNTTSTAGLAGRLDTLLTAHGFSVVRTTSDQQQAERTEIIVNKTSQENCQGVLQKIEKLLPESFEFLQDESQTNEYRADIVVKLGKDLVFFTFVDFF